MPSQSSRLSFAASGEESTLSSRRSSKGGEKRRKLSSGVNSSSASKNENRFLLFRIGIVGIRAFKLSRNSALKGTRNIAVSK